jgi:hypothetical protein
MPLQSARATLRTHTLPHAPYTLPHAPYTLPDSSHTDWVCADMPLNSAIWHTRKIIINRKGFKRRVRIPYVSEQTLRSRSKESRMSVMFLKHWVTSSVPPECLSRRSMLCLRLLTLNHSRDDLLHSSSVRPGAWDAGRHAAGTRRQSWGWESFTRHAQTRGAFQPRSDYIPGSTLHSNYSN